jgi:pimeloyl-ACP methyl ester carboxylesterase
MNWFNSPDYRIEFSRWQTRQTSAFRLSGSLQIALLGCGLDLAAPSIATPLERVWTFSNASGDSIWKLSNRSELAEHYEVIPFHNRGHGQSDKVFSTAP